MDWAKAFDSISPASLITALKRFGVPEALLCMISNIYCNRQFFVRDAGRDSKMYEQSFGISQGCPLSPFLFVMVMTVLMHDAKKVLISKVGDVSTSAELLYADDTLLIDMSGGHLQTYLESVIEVGAEYGLKLNMSKVELLRVRCTDVVRDSAGKAIKAKDSIVYLGSLLTNYGRPEPELSRRLGMAQADFKALRKVWNHTSLSRTKKLAIFDAVIVSKLMYSLAGVWLNKLSRKRLDGFQARCLRRVLGIPSAYESRVSNDIVRQKAHSMPLSCTLLQEQIRYFRQVATSCEESPLRLSAESETRKRRVGRPRLCWATEVHRHAVAMAGGMDELATLLTENKSTWKARVKSYCSQLSEVR